MTLKEQAVALVLANLRKQLQVAISGLDLASEGARGESTQNEGKYDTRAVEASYLAAGQADLVEGMHETIEKIETIRWDEERTQQTVAVGSLVEANQDGEDFYYLICPKGGGSRVEVQGLDIDVLSIDAPLAQELLGKQPGDYTDDQRLLILAVS